MHMFCKNSCHSVQHSYLVHIGGNKVYWWVLRGAGQRGHHAGGERSPCLTGYFKWCSYRVSSRG